MAKLNKLHLLYTGSEKGGAQRVALDCAMHNSDLYTSTVQSGGLIKLLQKKSLRVLDFRKLIFNYKFDIIFCSDPRALLFSFLCIRSIFSKKYLILHSDQKIKYKILITLFCRFFFIHCVCTTRTQFDSLQGMSAQTSLVRIADLPRMKTPSLKTNNILYFGRFDKIKNIQEIINIFLDAKKSNDDMELILVGSGDQTFTHSDGVQIINSWKSQTELIKIMDKCSFVVNATDHEGFSLQVMEGLSNGLFPLVKSKGLIQNYNLPDECYLNVENILNAVKMKESEWVQFVTSFQISLLDYIEDNVHLRDYISSSTLG